MANADKMFEELGFNKIEDSKSFIKYKSTRDYAEIWFDKADKEFNCSNDEDEAIFVSMKELQAIYEKCKELGWLNG